MKLLKLLKNIWQCIKSSSLSALLICLSQLFCLPELSAASLAEVVEISLQQNLALESAKLGQSASENDIAINRAKFLPGLSLSANTSWNENKTHKTGADTRSEYNSHGYSASLTQSIFNLKDIYSHRTSHLDLNIGQLQFEKTQQQTIQDVAATYFEILKNRAQQRATSAELNSATARYKQINRNVELGNVAGSEMYEVMAQKEQVANDLRTLKKDQRVLINKLENLIQYPAAISYDLIATTELESLPSDTVSRLDAVAAQENLDVQIAKKQVFKSKSLLRESGSNFLPSLSGSISYSHNDTNAESSDPLDTGRSEQVVYSLNLSMPLINGGSDYYRYQQSSLELSKAEVDLLDTVQNTQQAFYEAVSNINDNADSLNSLKAIIKANYASYKGIQRAYKLGTRTITDLLAAESKLFNSIRDYENARYSYLIETLGLEQLLGRLNMETINKISALMTSTEFQQNDSAIPLHFLEDGAAESQEITP